MEGGGGGGGGRKEGGGGGERRGEKGEEEEEGGGGGREGKGKKGKGEGGGGREDEGGGREGGERGGGRGGGGGRKGGGRRGGGGGGGGGGRGGGGRGEGGEEWGGWTAAAVVIAAVGARDPARDRLPAPLPRGDRDLAYGATEAPEAPPPRMNPFRNAVSTLREFAPRRDFQLIVFAFFVCGATTNGFIGTHFIAGVRRPRLHRGAAPGCSRQSASSTSSGTVCSGWLTDRVDPRLLLFWLLRRSRNIATGPPRGAHRTPSRAPGRS